jgi:hypothetical protein
MPVGRRAKVSSVHVVLRSHVTNWNVSHARVRDVSQFFYINVSSSHF